MTIELQEDRVIRLAIGSTPGKVIVKLGTTNTLDRTLQPRAGAVSCVWDTRRKPRPRTLRLTTRTTAYLNPRMSSYHGRYLYT